MKYVHAKCQLGTVAYLLTTAAGFLPSFTVSENSYVQSSVAAMHVHAAGSLILDCFVGSSHSSRVQITSSSFNRSIRKAVIICNSSNWICTANFATACCATLLPRRPVCTSAAHLPLLMVLVCYVLAGNVMQCLQPTPVLSGFSQRIK